MKLINEKHRDDKLMFEQYKLYVELTDRISQRRSSVNTFFITANSIIITVVSISGFDIKKYSWLITISGLVLSYAWLYLLHSYKSLNSGKFQVIHEIEKQLPLNLYSYEWQILEEGNNRAKYWPISHLEKILPIFFMIIYIVFEIIVLIGG